MKRIGMLVGVGGVILILLAGYLGNKNYVNLNSRLHPSGPVVLPGEPPGGGVATTEVGPVIPSAPAVSAAPPGSASPPPPASFAFTRMPPQVANVARNSELAKVIHKYAQKYGVDENLVWAVIRQESGFNPHAVSPKGAMGLMQLMPGTASLLGVTDPFDVEQNVAGGIKYLEGCLNRFNGDVCLALAAYNAGPDNVIKYQGCPPFPETRNYVASIIQAYAGGPIRHDLRIFNIGSAFVEEVPEAGQPPIGLPWRVPIPQWRVATPEVHISGPRWKVTQKPF